MCGLTASFNRQSPDCLGCEDEDDVHVSLTTSEEQSALLSSLEDFDAVKAVIPLNVDGTPAEDEKELYEILKNLKSTGGLNDIDGIQASADATSVTATEATPEDAKSPEEASQELPSVAFTDMYSSPPLIVLAVSCIAALLAVLCVGVGLYAYNRVNYLMVKSGLAWDILPQLERRVGLDMPSDDNATGGAHVPEKRRLIYDAPLPPLNVVDEKLSDDLDEKIVLIDIGDSDLDDSDEKFHDVPEHSLLFFDSDLLPQYELKEQVPRIVVEEHDDPDLLPLPEVHSNQSTPFSTPLRTPMRSPLASPTRSPARRAPQMREMQSSPTLSSKPLWSIRAADAPALGLSGPSSSSPTHFRSESPTPILPGALYSDDAPEVQVQRPRQRTPRQPLDIAFALQLRPGLGLGADSAWIVRFMMAMFGWMTFFIGGPARREETRRALTA